MQKTDRSLLEGRVNTGVKDARLDRLENGPARLKKKRKKDLHEERLRWSI